MPSLKLNDAAGLSKSIKLEVWDLDLGSLVPASSQGLGDTSDPEFTKTSGNSWLSNLHTSIPPLLRPSVALHFWCFKPASPSVMRHSSVSSDVSLLEDYSSRTGLGSWHGSCRGG